MSLFGNGRDDNLPATPKPPITTVPVTDKQGCYRPAVRGEATVDGLAVELYYNPGSRN